MCWLRLKSFCLVPIIWAINKGSVLPLYGTTIVSYIDSKGVLITEGREFVYVGDSVPELNEREHAAFLMNIQHAILLSLEKRKLLTSSQRERCLLVLEKQYSQSRKNGRRV